MLIWATSLNYKRGEFENMKKFLTICSVALCLGVTVSAEVVDKAGMFSSSAVHLANQKLEEIKRKSGKELVIETVEQVGQVDANKLALEKAKSRKVNGVYVLISKNDRKLKVEVGNNTKQVFGDFERSTLRAKITEEFKSQNFDGGLNSSVDYFVGIMESAVGNKNSLNSNYPQRSELPYQKNQTTGGIPWMSIIIFGVIAFIVFKIITSLMNSNKGGTGNVNQPYGSAGYGNSGPSFMSTFLTGMLGAAAGSWLYDKFTGHDSGLYGNDHSSYDGYRSGNNTSWSQSDTDYSGDSSDSGWGDSGGSDWGGGDGGSDW